MIEEWQLAAGGRFRSQIFEGGHFYWGKDASPLLHEISADLVDSFDELA